MRPQWQRYWKAQLRYLPYFPIGIPISLIPFLINFSAYQREGRVLGGLFVCLIYGFAIPIAISMTYAAALAVLTWLRKMPMKIGLLFHMACMSFGLVCGIWLALLAKRVIFAEPRTEVESFLPALIFGAFIMVLTAANLVYRQARDEALALRAVVAEARYQTLEHQMRPHFLFNALNSLAEMIESDHARAGEMVFKLSNLYRQILANSKTKTASLDSEIDVARQYLELEQVRFGKRLSFSIESCEGEDAVFVPSLVLQTLVENAVKHGVSKSLEGGNVAITVTRASSGLYSMTVANTGEPYRDNGTAGTGLANTRDRLNLLYGDRHQFRVAADESGRTVATFMFTGEKID